jgi:hypothetical protein
MLKQLAFLKNPIDPKIAIKAFSSCALTVILALIPHYVIARRQARSKHRAKGQFAGFKNPCFAYERSRGFGKI